MMKKREVYRFFTEILRCELTGEKLPPEIAAKINGETAEKLYTLSGKHDLTHVVCFSLLKNGVKIPADLKQKFKRAYLSQTVLSERQSYDLSVIEKALEEEKIPFVFLKGSSLKNLYPYPDLRPTRDIDVLVKKEDFDSAYKKLLKVFDGKEHLKGVYDVSFTTFSGENIELHFSLIREEGEENEIISHVWDYTLPCEGYKKEFAPEFSLVYLMYHAAGHFKAGGCGVKPLLDFYIMSEQKDYDAEKVAELAEKAGLGKFTEYISALSDVWFRGKKAEGQDAEILSYLEEYIMSGGSFGTLKNAVIIGGAIKGGENRYILRRIFLPYKDLCVLFPSLKKCPPLYPFYLVARWFKVLFSGRLKKASKEMRINGSVSKKARASAKKLYDALELK